MTMQRPPCRFRLVSALLLSLFLFCLPAEALLIDFEGYTPGNLDGQPASGTRWSGGGGDFLIEDGIGVAGSTALVTTSPSAASVHTVFSPDANDLSGFDGNRSLVNISFQFRFDELPDTATNNANAAMLQFGWNHVDAQTAATFVIKADGRLLFYSGSNAVNINLAHFPIADTTTWTTVAATLDYERKKWSFSINGISYSTPGGTSEFNFRGSSTTSAILRLTNSGGSNHRPVVLDQLSITVIPEPSTLALLFPALLAGGILQRRFRRS